MSIEDEWDGDPVETGVYAYTVAYGGGKWVVGGFTTDPFDPESVGIAYALDPEGPWTKTTAGGAQRANKLIYAEGKWAGAGGNTDGKFLMSTNGTSWSVYDAGDWKLTDVAYHDGKWVAVGWNGVHVSTGGAPTSYSNVLSGESIAYGGGYWVMGTWQGLAYTTNVTGSWTSNGTFSGKRVSALAYSGGRWLAVGGVYDISNDYKPTAWTATDPTGAWTEIDPGGSEPSFGFNALYRVAAFLDDTWIVAKANDPSAPTVFYYASDPTGSWDSVSLADSDTVDRDPGPAIAFDDGTWVATAGGNYPSVIYQSGAGDGWGLLL